MTSFYHFVSVTGGFLFVAGAIGVTKRIHKGGGGGSSNLFIHISLISITRYNVNVPIHVTIPRGSGTLIATPFPFHT